MCNSVEQRCCHLAVSEYLRPFTESQVRCYEQRGPLIELGYQVKEQLPSALGKRQVTQFVQDNDIEPSQVLRKPSAPSADLLLFQLVNQVDNVEVSAALTLLNQVPSKCDRQMGFAGASAADQQDIAACRQETALV